MPYKDRELKRARERERARRAREAYRADLRALEAAREDGVPEVMMTMIRRPLGEHRAD